MKTELCARDFRRLTPGLVLALAPAYGRVLYVSDLPRWDLRRRIIALTRGKPRRDLQRLYLLSLWHLPAKTRREALRVRMRAAARTGATYARIVVERAGYSGTPGLAPPPLATVLERIVTTDP